MYTKRYVIMKVQWGEIQKGPKHNSSRYLLYVLLLSNFVVEIGSSILERFLRVHCSDPIYRNVV